MIWNWSPVSPSLHNADLNPFQAGRVHWQCGCNVWQHAVRSGSSCPQRRGWCLGQAAGAQPSSGRISLQCVTAWSPSAALHITYVFNENFNTILVMSYYPKWNNKAGQPHGEQDAALAARDPSTLHTFSLDFQTPKAVHQNCRSSGIQHWQYCLL